MYIFKSWHLYFFPLPNRNCGFPFSDLISLILLLFCFYISILKYKWYVLTPLVYSESGSLLYESFFSTLFLITFMPSWVPQPLIWFASLMWSLFDVWVTLQSDVSVGRGTQGGLSCHSAWFPLCIINDIKAYLLKFIIIQKPQKCPTQCSGWVNYLSAI